MIDPMESRMDGFISFGTKFSIWRVLGPKRDEIKTLKTKMNISIIGITKVKYIKSWMTKLDNLKVEGSIGRYSKERPKLIKLKLGELKCKSMKVKELKS